MTAFPDPFSDGAIDADLPWEPLRGLPADDAYWDAMAEAIEEPVIRGEEAA